MQLEKKNKILNNLYLLKTMGYKYINENELLNNSNSNLLPSNINELNDIVNNCNLCSISNSCNNKIFFKGDYKSKIIFIVNKAFKDDKTYELFKNILKSILNIDIQNILILNVLKCDANINTDDYKNDIDLCKRYTLKQIEILKPKLIIALGSSYKYLKEENNIKKGILLKYNNIDLFVSYDLEYILRNPSIKKDVLIHYKKINTIMEKI